MFAHAPKDTRLTTKKPAVATAVVAFTAVVHEWRQRRETRKMLRDELIYQPDSVLHDAGWTRPLAVKEAKKPFWMA